MISIFIKKSKFSKLVIPYNKKLIRLALSIVIFQGIPYYSITQSQALRIPERSTAEQIFQDYSASINQGEVVMNLVVEEQRIIPTKSFILFQNQPNPFTKKTTVQFELLESTAVTLTIYDPEGAVLKEYKGHFEKGRNQIQINGKDLKQYGTLYYQMTTKHQILSKKMSFQPLKNGDWRLENGEWAEHGLRTAEI